MKRLKHCTLLLVLCCTAIAAEPETLKGTSVQKWEYKVVSTVEIAESWQKKPKEEREKDLDDFFEPYLNKLGSKGWELVLVNKVNAYVFKRPIKGKKKVITK